MTAILRIACVAGLLFWAANSAQAEESVKIADNLSQAACGECAACEDFDCGCCPPSWYASVGAMVLHRSRPADQAIVAGNPNSADVFSSGADFEFDWDTGVEVTLGYQLPCCCNILEFRFFEVDGAEATNQFVTPGNFIGVGFTGPGGTNFSGRYLTKLHSTEINLRHPTTDRLTLLAGFRWIELKDEMVYKLNGNVATGRYEYNNHLYGGQIGADLALFESCSPWQVNVVGKAGLYGNVADGGIDEFQGNNFIGGFRGEGTETAFVGEVGISAAYHVNCHVALRGGYELLWLNEVALASDNASFSLLNPSLLRNQPQDGPLFYHGATFGIDLTW